MKPRNQSIGLEKKTRPRYIVNSQLKTFTPVGTAISIVMIPKKALTLGEAPIVKKWCSQTMKERNVMEPSAHIMERYPKILLCEKVATTSEKIPKAGRIKM